MFLSNSKKIALKFIAKNGNYADKEAKLKDTFDSLLKVLRPETPAGTISDTQKLAAAFPSAFSLESSRAIHSELSVFSNKP